MSDPYKLQRFVDAQDEYFNIALDELRAGSKQSHWMWYIFPQLAALGRSPTSKFYGIGSVDEARAYLDHPQLGTNLRKCLGALMHWAGLKSADQILGSIDAMKLRSCLTRFEAISGDASFGLGLEAFFDGERDELTLALLNAER
jgi:uncharacterized protein (DUF1810 family)